jgi:hypothetical protein
MGGIAPRSRTSATALGLIITMQGDTPAATDLLRATVQALCRGNLSCRSGKRISFLILP